jgi:hypothetical protein
MAETSVQFSRFPDIKIRNSVNEAKRGETTETQRENKKTKVINFFDIPSPVNEQKVAIVRNALFQRKTISPNPGLNDEDLEVRTAMRKSYQNPKTEFELQVDFLNEKTSKKRLELKSTDLITSKDPKEEKISTDSKIQNIFQEPFKLPENLEILKEPSSPIKKSESMQVLPSFSPSKVPQDLTPHHSSDMNPSSLITLLQSEISELKSTNTLLTQELFNQQQSFEALSRNHIDQKQAMNKEASLLMNDFSSTKSRLEDLENEIKRLKNDKTRLKTELELNLQVQNESLTKSEARLFLLNEEIQEKDRDYEILKDQLKTSEQNRKKILEVSKELEIEMILTKKQKENIEKDLQELNQKHEDLLNEFRMERNKALAVDDLKQEVFQVNYEVSLIRDENKELVIAKNIALESLDTVQKNFDNSRLSWREKENSYNNTIQDLLEQIQSERAKTQVQAAESAKLRRALTLKDNDSYTNITKDEISRYQQKLMQIEKDYNESLNEIEKLKRNIEYYRHIVRNKEEIIKKIEIELKKPQDFFNAFKKLVSCEKCEMVGYSFITFPCKHLVCGHCKSSVCPVCEEVVDSFQGFCETEKIIKAKQIFDEIVYKGE